MRLLIIEDEEDILHALMRGFQKKGYITDGVADGQEGLFMAQTNSYDLIVLDLNLPNLDGMEILQEIRNEDANQKIIILSARTGFDDRICGLDKGANDYLVKPFHFGELEARVRNLLRRDFVQNDTLLCCGDLKLDTVARRAYIKEKPVELAPKEFAILEYLFLNRNKPISSEQLVEHVWQEDSSLFSNVVKVHMSSLRKKLDGCVRINHMRGAGYLMEKGDKE